jgi:PAS domain S-box-containing protein
MGDVILKENNEAETLIDSSKGVELFFTHSLDIMCVAGIDGYFKRVNPAFTRELGYTEQELLAQPFLGFIHDDDQAITIAEVEKLSTGAPTLHFVNRYRCKNGSYKWLEWTSSPSREEGLLYCVGRDVTARRQAEIVAANIAQRLAQDADQARHASEASDGIIAMDSAHRITEFNSVAENMFGLTSGDVLGSSLDSLIPARFRSAHGAQVRRFGESKISDRLMGKPGKVFGLHANGSEFLIDASISQRR